LLFIKKGLNQASYAKIVKKNLSIRISINAYNVNQWYFAYHVLKKEFTKSIGSFLLLKKQTSNQPFVLQFSMMN